MYLNFRLQELSDFMLICCMRGCILFDYSRVRWIYMYFCFAWAV